MRSFDLPEALLELHYFPAFRQLLEEHYGRYVLRILKPSQREEAYLGFDQGFVVTTIPGAEIRKQLAAAIATTQTPAPTLYVGYFLQYKCVELMMRRRQALPASISTPYYRVDLSLVRNTAAGISQHETLLRLQALGGTDVCYACPMIFSEDDLWREASVDEVRIVPLSEAPSGWVTTERHHIVFHAKDDKAPLWCSEPSPGSSRSLRAWIESQPRRLWSGRETLTWLEHVRLNGRDAAGHETRPSCLTIVEFGASRQQA